MKKTQVYKATEEKSVPGPGNRYELAIDESVATELLHHLIVWVQLPDVERRQLDIRLAGNVLTIKEAEEKVIDFTNLQRSQIVGNSPELKTCLNQVARAACKEDAVLICGETGTGKELFARAVHQNSRRDGENFVVVDCRSIPESIAEKLLLGQPRSARFGHHGLLPQANKGTLFLDEVADLPSSTQRLFYRLLQDEKYRPVGAVTDIRVNFRLIAATNRNLQQLAEQGKFDPVLLHMLQQHVVEIPPLRKRKGDISLLTDYFLTNFCKSRNIALKEQSPEFQEMLNSYPWPGNVRELENSLVQALLAARNKKTLFPKDLPSHIRVHVKKSSVGRKKKAVEDFSFDDDLFGGLFATDNPL
ncbi:Sigma-54 interaction domain-containing protein [Malonomonas rubra DSM 5091]|uniref:Sigma-54 interaction domain-containing protein n=1 Tax=Malonomonas rubra DSM 5091 TaxID=1122189 RepID=A0A1M6JW29_MALRU|nr:sigma 54-interacting transcriptional regulator [Malonomonas rubra]SHJ50872.1 Sigma-54 interaction domain-containing protein [Malonomonas rubra DSM 5091]